MPVARWRLGPLRRRLAPLLVVLVVGGTAVGVQAGVDGSAWRHGVVQTSEAPADPEDYVDRGVTSRLVEADSSEDGDGARSNLAMSDDGRFLVFSTRNALVDEHPEDDEISSNDLADIYLLDRDADEDGSYDESETVEPTLVTLGYLQPFEGTSIRSFRAQPGPPLREPSNSGSYDPDLSGDGRFVVFTSTATNLVPDSPDFSDDRDIYRWDRLNPDLPPVWVSGRAPNEGGFTFSDDPTVSDDGARVAFVHSCSEPIGLRAAPLFAPPVCTSATVLVQDIPMDADPQMVPLEGTAGNPIPLVCQFHEQPVITGDGTSVFLLVRGSISQSGCQEIFEYVLARFDLANPDLVTALPTVFAGVTLGADQKPMGEPSISRDGGVLAFSADLPHADPQLADVRQVFVRNQVTGAVELISRVGAEPGGCGDGFCFPDSGDPSISSDGRYVAYRTQAQNILRAESPVTSLPMQVVVRDRFNEAAENELVSVGLPPEFPDPSFPQVSGLSELQANVPVAASHPGGGGIPAGTPIVAFISFASNLDEGSDGPTGTSTENVFVRSFTSARLNGPLEDAGDLARFDFGDSPVGVSGNIQSVPATADPFGFGPLSVLGAVISGGSSAFTLSTSQCGGVQPGQTCFVSVEFRPLVVGFVEPGILAVTYDTNPLYEETQPEAIDPRIVEIALVGRGVPSAPTVVVNPTAVAFGAITIGTVSQPTTVNVSVTPGGGLGTLPAIFTDIRIAGLDPGDYQLDASGCLNVPVFSGGSCPILVRFSPTKIGIRSAVLELRTSPSDPSPRLVPLTGSGAQPTIELNPAVVHAGGVIGVLGDLWPPGQDVRLTIQGMPKPIEAVVRPDGTIELPTVIFFSRNFGPREVMAEVVADPTVRLAQPVILLVQAPGSNVVDLIGRS